MPTTLEQLQYGFDRDSRRTWRQRATTQGWDNAYVYNSLSQVIDDDRGDLNLAHNAIAGVPANGSRWQYDETGNWHGYQTLAEGALTLNQARTHDKGNRLMEVSEAPTMRTDRAGRILETVPGPNGDWSEGYHITWDAWSRIVGVASVDGEASTPVATYGYDGLTRRITRYTDEEDVTLHSYYNDEWRPVEERKESESTAAVSYLWGSRHRDDLVRRDRAVGGTTHNETRYVLMDYFNPAALSDETGAVTERYAFSAFGVRTVLNADFTVRGDSECEFEFAFQGQFLDIESGLMNYGYRYYSPHLGRWPCKDPIEERGGANLYMFARNTSVNEVDKLGLLTDLDYEVWDHALHQHATWDWLIPGANMRPNGESLVVESERILSESQAVSALSEETRYACDQACGNDGEMFEHTGILSGIQTDHILAIGKINGEFHIWAQKGYIQSQCVCNFKFLLLLLPDRFDFEYGGRGLAAESAVFTATVAQTIAGYRPFLIVPVGAIQHTKGQRFCSPFR